jgi:CBS domain containing-hemolysin-like protein
MLEVALGLVVLVITLLLSTVQTNLEIEEDPRAGSLSIARAFLLVLLGAGWIALSETGLFAIALSLGLIAIWLVQQVGGRMLGRAPWGARQATRLDGFVTAWAQLAHPLRLRAPEVVEEYEQDLIDSVEEFSETVVREIMVPRVDLEVVDADELLEQSLAVFIASGYSRLPVVGEDVDDIVGVLYLKDIARLVHQNPKLLSERTARMAARPAHFIPETKPVSELLQELQASRTQIVLVVDEYGGVAGLVTIEDLIEELVGEISDEYDRDVEEIEEIYDGLYRVNPRVTLDELAEHCDMDLEDEDVDTVGGLLTKAVGELPKGGEVVEILGLELTAERVDKKRGRILSIQVRKLAVDD